MLKLIGKWLKVYEDEINLFLWSALLLFLIRSSNIIFNNFAETAFLKRFGVQVLLADISLFKLDIRCNLEMAYNQPISAISRPKAVSQQR